MANKKPDSKLPVKPEDKKITKPKATKPRIKHPGGRPTKYKPIYADALIAYFSQDVIKEIKSIISGKNWQKEEVRYEATFFPTLELFANEIDVDDDTIVEWASARYPEDYAVKRLRGTLKHPEFSAAYTRAKKIQKGLVLQYGLLGKLDSRFAQFFAINNLGMKSKVEVEESGQKKIIVETRIRDDREND